MTFERMASLACWPASQWTYILGPYLSGPAQTVWRTLPAADVSDCAKLKVALLDQYGMTEDSFCLCFHTVHYTPRTSKNGITTKARGSVPSRRAT